MTLWKSEHGSAYGVIFRSPGKRLDLPFLIVVGTAPGVLLLGLVPLQLVLPALSIVSFAVAVVIALWAYRRGVDRHANGMTLWHVAGLFAVIWVGAGMLSTPEHVVALFDHVTMTR
jgi:uncharacterized membrane protein YphA (DoxX/SURF4 family)